MRFGILGKQFFGSVCRPGRVTQILASTSRFEFRQAAAALLKGVPLQRAILEQ